MDTPHFKTDNITRGPDVYRRERIMSTNSDILLMVQIMFECPLCEGRAIVTDYDGNSRCVKCNPKKF